MVDEKRLRNLSWFRKLVNSKKVYTDHQVTLFEEADRYNYKKRPC